MFDLNEDEVFLTEYLIDSLDYNGWINRELFSISDDLSHKFKFRIFRTRD